MAASSKVPEQKQRTSCMHMQDFVECTSWLKHQPRTCASPTPARIQPSNPQEVCPAAPHRPELARAYCGEMAFYLSGIGMLLFWETRRKDFWIMMTHHFATLTLIGFSYWLKCAPPATNSPSYSRALDVSGCLAWRRVRISSANLALWGSIF